MDSKTTLTWLLRDEVSGTAHKIDQSLTKLGEKGGKGAGLMGSLGSSIGGLINPMTLAAGAGGLLVAALVGGAKAAAESAKIDAQTAAVIKSTGAAAGVTAQHVDDLANSIKDYSGIDDDAVKQGENLLLTFTNIQNKAGEGNDIFDQSTAILADMSTAMGTDMASGAIQLGKALNDPIAGISALSRVGVTFTEEQKAQIEQMTKVGDTAGAQRVILGELNKEFGGSAKAAGDSASGTWNKLQNSIGDLTKKIGGALLPILAAVAAFANDTLLPALSVMADVIGPVLGAAFDALGKAISWWVNNILKPAIAVIRGMLGFLHDVLKTIGIINDTPVQSAPQIGYDWGVNGEKRAAGGPVEAGGTYTVGENGPEQLVMGSRSGTIIPNGASSGGMVPAVIPVMLDGREIARITDERLYWAHAMAAPTRLRS